MDNEVQRTIESPDLQHADADLYLDNQLSFSLYSTSNQISRVYNLVLKEFGITFTQMFCLMALWEKSPLLVGDIAKRLELDNGTITPLLKRLDARGFIKRTRDPGDERRVVVEILEKGLALKQPVRAIRDKLHACVGVEIDIINDLRNGVKKFSKHVSQM